MRALILKYFQTSPKSKIAFYTFALGFILLNSWLVLTKDTLLGVVIPVVLLFALVAIFSYDKLFWMAIFFTPFSVPLKEFVQAPFDMLLPTEPLVFAILILFFIGLITGRRLPKALLQHPISIAIYVYLGWMMVTVFTSTLPLVSIKFFLNRLWYIVAFYFLAAYLFRDRKNIDKFVWVYMLALLPVIAYTIFRHAGYGLYDKQAAHFVMTPFFNDHTSYGAILAFFIPFLMGYAFTNFYASKRKFWSTVLLIIFVVAIILSYTRAAWLSLFIGFGVWFMMRMKIKFRTLLISVGALLLMFFAFQKQIIMKLEQNSQDSSSNLTEHLNSMTNISTDASNVERINRWSCAIQMFNEKPVLGWGPGTYAMNYAPFQLTKYRTIISTNSGDGGNAHSEYLGALAESGVFGTLTFIVLIAMVLYYGIMTHIHTRDKHLRTLVISAVVALMTYYVHAFLNNFLDIDKAAVPFWGFTAIIVALDIYHREQAKSNSVETFSSEI